MRQSILSVCVILILLTACTSTKADVTPSPLSPSQTAPATLTITPEPSPTPPALQESYYPMALEVISPDNIDRLEQIDRWGEGNIHNVALSPDEKTIAVYTVTGIHLYDSVTLEETQFIDTGISNDNFSRRTSPIAFNPDGSLLAYGDGHRIKMWNLTTNQLEGWIYSVIPDSPVSVIEFNPEGTRILVITHRFGYCDGTGVNYALYDLQGHLLFDQYGCADYSVNAYRFTTDGRFYLFFNSIMDIQNPNRLFVVDQATGSLLKSEWYESTSDSTKHNPKDSFYDVSPNGKHIASYIYEGDIGTTLIKEAETGNVHQTVEGLILFVDSENGEPAWVESPNNPGYREDPDNEKCGITKKKGYNKYSELINFGNKAVLYYSAYYSIHYLTLWDYSTCEVEKEISFPAANLLVFGPNGQFLATSSITDIYLWNTQSKEVELKIRTNEYTWPESSFAFNSDGTWLITLEEILPDKTYQILIWDIQSGKLLRTLKPTVSSSHYIFPSHQKNIVAVGDSNLNKLLFWNIETGELLFTTTYGVPEYDENGNVWISLGEKEGIKKLVLYDIQKGTKLQTIYTPYTWFRNIHLSEDGSKLVGLTYNQEERQEHIVIYDINTGEQTNETLIERRTTNKMVGKGNIFVIYGSHGYIDFWDFEGDTPFLTIQGNLKLGAVNDDWSGYGYSSSFDLLFSPDGRVLITESNTYDIIRFWDTQTGNLLGEISLNFEIDYSTNIVFSPDGRIIAVTGEDGLIRIWGVPEE